MNIKTENSTLLCPHCGEPYLHHAEVEVFTRHEDADMTLATTVGPFISTTEYVKSEDTDNPSSRRGGIQIRFWCEICTEDSYLTIAQHKGSTYVEWKD